MSYIKIPFPRLRSSKVGRDWSERCKVSLTKVSEKWITVEEWVDDIQRESGFSKGVMGETVPNKKTEIEQAKREDIKILPGDRVAALVLLFGGLFYAIWKFIWGAYIYVPKMFFNYGVEYLEESFDAEDGFTVIGCLGGTFVAVLMAFISFVSINAILIIIISFFYRQHLYALPA